MSAWLTNTTVDHNLQEHTVLAETTLGKPAMMGPCLQSHKAVFGLSVEFCSHFPLLQLCYHSCKLEYKSSSSHQLNSNPFQTTFKRQQSKN